MSSNINYRIHMYDKKHGLNFAFSWRNGRTLFYCPECGVEYVDLLIEPKSSIKCPCCGSEARYDLGFCRIIIFKEYFSKNIPEQYDCIVTQTAREAGLCYLVDKGDAHKELKKVDKYYKEMRDIRSAIAAAKKVERFVNSIDVKNNVITKDFDPDKFKSDKRRLSDYIKSIISIENVVFALTKRLENLYFEKMKSEAEIKTQYSEQLLEIKKELKKSKITTPKVNPQEFNKPQPIKPKEPLKPVYQQAGFFNKRKIDAENLKIKEKYEEKLKLYEYKLNKYDNDLKTWHEEKENHELMRKKFVEEQADARNKEAAEYRKSLFEKKNDLMSLFKKDVLQTQEGLTKETLKVKLYADEIKEVKDLLKTAIECKSEMYDYEIIFVKYRNIVALSSFYEYLVSGRCDSLEGSSGAYNLYESELRANLIIDKLSDIMQSLEQIQQNQFMLYSELRKINENLESLNRSMDNAVESLSRISESGLQIAENTRVIADNTEVIAYNTEKTAYYSKLNAELTDAVGLMVALS